MDGPRSSQPAKPVRLLIAAVKRERKENDSCASWRPHVTLQSSDSLKSVTARVLQELVPRVTEKGRQFGFYEDRPSVYFFLAP